MLRLCTGCPESELWCRFIGSVARMLLNLSTKGGNQNGGWQEETLIHVQRSGSKSWARTCWSWFLKGWKWTVPPELTWSIIWDMTPFQWSCKHDGQHPQSQHIMPGMPGKWHPKHAFMRVCPCLWVTPEVNAMPCPVCLHGDGCCLAIHLYNNMAHHCPMIYWLNATSSWQLWWGHSRDALVGVCLWVMPEVVLWSTVTWVPFLFFPILSFSFPSYMYTRSYQPSISPLTTYLWLTSPSCVLVPPWVSLIFLIYDSMTFYDLPFDYSSLSHSTDKQIYKPRHFLYFP